MVVVLLSSLLEQIESANVRIIYIPLKTDLLNEYLKIQNWGFPSFTIPLAHTKKTTTLKWNNSGEFVYLRNSWM